MNLGLRDGVEELTANPCILILKRCLPIGSSIFTRLVAFGLFGRNEFLIDCFGLFSGYRLLGLGPGLKRRTSATVGVVNGEAFLFFDNGCLIDFV